MAPPYSARTPRDIRRAAREHKVEHINVILDLAERDLKSPTSKWNIRHLIAYRLLVRPESEFLPIFTASHRDHCPVCWSQSVPPQDQMIDICRVESLIGDTPRDLGQQAEGQLLRLPQGFFWSALARAVRQESPGSMPGKTYSQRERAPVQREGFVHYATAIPGSSPSNLGSSPSNLGSSPSNPLTSSEFSLGTVDLDDDEHNARASKPEEVTVHLAICFLQVALNLCLLQHSPGSTARAEIRPRIERLRSVAEIAGEYSVTAEDDGGICRMKRLHGREWEMEHTCLAIIEAKRAFKYLDFDDRQESYVPVVSNENLAQCLGEAIVTWKANPELLEDE